jgi:hypothetical protein
MAFAWDDWNVEHIGAHDVTPMEAEYVVDPVQPPWPDQKGDEKLLVWGPTEDGRLLQVIFTLKHPDEVAFEALTMEEWAGLGENDRIVYVVHAMELTPVMKQRYRKRRKAP